MEYAQIRKSDVKYSRVNILGQVTIHMILQLIIFYHLQSELCHQLYDTIRNHKKEDGSLLCDAFIRVPKRRQEPGYYEVDHCHLQNLLNVCRKCVKFM
jgi:hypothetical protein